MFFFLEEKTTPDAEKFTAVGSVWLGVAAVFEVSFRKSRQFSRECSLSRCRSPFLRPWVTALSMTSEAFGIDSKNYLFHMLSQSVDGIPNFIVDTMPIEVCKPTRSGRCTMSHSIIGNKGYISAEVQLNLFEAANIRPETPSRSNQKGAKPFPFVFRKVRKRINYNESLLFIIWGLLCNNFIITTIPRKSTATEMLKA